jgi:predicted S18 family serine protease
MGNRVTGCTMERLCAIVLVALLILAATAPLPVTASNMDKTGAQTKRVLSGWVYVPAVSGHKGVLVNLSMLILWPGRGSVNVSSEGTVSASTAYSISAAIWTSALLLGINPLSFDARVKIHTGGMVSGPSASLAAATLAMVLLSSYYSSRTHEFVITGAIIPQGFAGPIGGVNEKCDAAMKNNLSFILPAANEVELTSSCRKSNSSNYRIFSVGSLFGAYSLVTDLNTLNGLSMPNGSYPKAMSEVLAKSTLSMLNKTNEILEKINKMTNKKTYINILSIINDIKRNINLSKKVVEEYPYSAASLAFTALSQSLGLYYSILLNEGKLNDEKIISNIKLNLTNLKKYINIYEKNVSCLEKMELLSVAAARISDSLWNLENYEKLRKSKVYSLTDLGYTLGLAEARLYSIESWLQAFKKAPCHTPMPSSFYNYIKIVKYFSDINGNYTASVLEEVGLNETASLLRDLMERADRAFARNDTALALGYYRELLSLSTELMFSKLILSQYNVKSVLEKYIKAGMELYSYTYYLLALHGLRSVLAPAYMEYAGVLMKYSGMNSSIPILASAIAANEVLLPLILAPLAPGNASLTVSAPYTGATSPSRAPSGEAVAAVISAVVIGFSFGVAVALRMALMQRRRIAY